MLVVLQIVSDVAERVRVREEACQYLNRVTCGNQEINGSSILDAPSGAALLALALTPLYERPTSTRSVSSAQSVSSEDISLGVRTHRNRVMKWRSSRVMKTPSTCFKIKLNFLLFLFYQLLFPQSSLKVALLVVSLLVISTGVLQSQVVHPVLHV